MKKHLFLVALLLFTLSAFAQGSRVSLRTDGTILVNNQPFYPLGIYHVSWESSASEMLTDLRTVAAAGFTTVHASQTSTNNFGAFLDEAHRLGVYVIMEGITPGTIAHINQYKNKPALLGYSIGDDVHENVSAEELKNFYTRVKAADPDHITFHTVYSWSKWGPYMTVGDMTMPYNYPVPDSWLGEVDYAMTQARAYNRPMCGIPQAYVWPGKRSPTANEYRNMTYQNIINNVRGLIPYTFRDGGQYLPDNTVLWNAAKAAVTEAKTLAPVLMNGKFTRVNTGVYGEPGLQAAYWEYQNQVYAIVLNTSTTDTKTAKIQLPTGITGPVQAVFTSGPSGLTLNAGSLTGSVRPYEVHVYKIGTGSSLADGIYKLTSKVSVGGSPLRCLDVSSSQDVDGRNVQLWETNPTAAQQWSIQSTGDGYYKLVSQVGGKTRLLDADKGGRGNGSNVQLWSPNATNGGDNQRWKIESTDDGYYKLTTKASATETTKYCLDVYQGINANGGSDSNDPKVGNVQIYQDNSSDAQRWRIEAATAARITSQEKPAGEVALVSLAPNPASESVTLTLQAKQVQTVVVSIINGQGVNTGQVKKAVQAGKQQITLSVGHYLSGLYLLQVTVDGQRHVKKLVINHE